MMFVFVVEVISVDFIAVSEEVPKCPPGILVGAPPNILPRVALTHEPVPEVE